MLPQGTCHFKYYLDSQLVAVNICDLLPNQLISTYFFYEIELREYDICTFSVLLEIAYIREMNKYFPAFRYYNIGQYQFQSKKINYKSKFKVQEILCPITYKYVLFDKKVKQLIKSFLDTPQIADLDDTGHPNKKQQPPPEPELDETLIFNG